jgi:RNA polymerase subunit RPABC4/transcription elongation factor Spt4
VPGGPVPVARRTVLWVLVVSLVASAVVAGAMASPLGAPGGSRASVTAPSPPSSASPAASSTTHGDLNVTAGETVYIPGPTPPIVRSTYYQGGNITVFSGGKLVVQNVTLSFVQFVGTTGVPAVRLAHLFRFDVQAGGTVDFVNATLTTDAFLVNPYLKLTVVVDGNMTLYDSNIEAPGFIDVGSHGNLTLNSSSLAPNPAVSSLDLASSTVGDLDFAPTLNVSAGGTANLFSSVYRDLYGDDFGVNGVPYPNPLTTTAVTVTNGASRSNWSTPTDPGSVIQDYLYPAGVEAGQLYFEWVDTNNATVGDSTFTFTLTYDGTPYTLGTYTFVYQDSGAFSFAFPYSLVQAINNNGGMLGWLNRTGDFGLPSGVSLGFTGTGASITLPVVELLPTSPVDFGMNVVGGGLLYTVNSYIGLDFAEVGSSPWVIHTLNLTGGSDAYLANLTVQGELQNGTEQIGTGAIIPDATSHAYLYRWAEVQSYGSNGELPVPDATVTVNYAYSSSQADNATANGLNNLRSAALPIWGYVQYWDRQMGYPAYGVSGTNGIASVLVASNNIYGASAPDGDYLGDYHVSVAPPTGGGPAQTFTALVSAYPAGVANGSAGYNGADSWGTLTFPDYFAKVVPSVSNGITVTVNNRAGTLLLIGMTLNVTVNVTDSGPAPISSINGTLYYNATSHIAITSAHKTVDLTAPGQTAALEFSWHSDDNVTGLQGTTVDNNLSLVIVWNHDEATAGGGSFGATSEIQVQPSNVTERITDYANTTSLSANTQYESYGYLTYNGTQAAIVTVYAIPVHGGAGVTLTSETVGPSHVEGKELFFTVQWLTNGLTVGTSYYLSIVATYNGVTANKTSTQSFTIPTPPVTHFFFEKFLGLPIWEWMAIAAAIVVGLVGFLLWSRQQAAGKLVECGECGNLVPEDSKTCPKCGAEFESDVVRCSRCSSTIPANSKFCPECAAQLLGKPGEEALDPERQAYADFTERFRAEAKKELGDNYSEGSFWDWWKRQSTYTPFSQWKMQQGQGTTRAGMTAPPPGSPPPSGGAAAPARAGARRPAAPPAARPPASGTAPSAAAAPAAAAVPAAPPAAEMPSTAPGASAPGASAPGALKPCPNCGKEIPPEYLVCPFCGSVTQ